MFCSCTKGVITIQTGRYVARTPSEFEFWKFKITSGVNCKVWGDSSEILTIDSDSITRIIRDKLIFKVKYKIINDEIITSSDSFQIKYIVKPHAMYYLLKPKAMCDGNKPVNYYCLKKYIYIGR